MKSYGKLTAVLVVGWFIFSLSASASHLFENPSNRLGFTVAIAALAPIVVFSLWFAASESFRQFAMSWNPTLLTALQSWRIVGFIFVLLEARGILPAIFALPAGYGDMAIGITAAFVAWKLASADHRNWFIFWQLLGIADLVTAVSMGSTAPLLDPHGVPMAAITALPLSLIPTFLVPLFLIFHIVCIAQARTWKTATTKTRQTIAPVQHPVV